MSSASQTCSLRRVQRLFNEGILASQSDAELVERFARERDPDVFAAIVARHGPMVMAVCLGHIGSTGDADDAFQATFLILLNRAGTFPVGQSLGGWLHSVARRVARQARRAHARRRRRELAVGSRFERNAEYGAERVEIVQIIRQEIDRLPERYRAPIVLCDLHGLTRDQAAQLLGCPAGTVGGRLARARQRLRERLERRGISASLILTPLAGSPAGTWRVSLEAAIRATSSLAAGRRAAPAVLHLAAHLGRAVVGVPVKLSLSAALVAVAAIGMVAARNDAEPPTPLLKAITSASQPVKEPDPENPKEAGHFVGRVNGPDGRPMAGARLFMVPGDPRFPRRDPCLVQPGAVRAISSADGRFDFDAPDMTFIELDGLPARRLGLLIATADGYAPDWVFTWGQNRRPYGLRGDPVKSVEITLQLARDDVPLHGRLLDHEGRPLAGAHVRLDGLTIPWKRDLDAHLNSKDRAWAFGDEQTFSRTYVLPGVAAETITDRDGRFKMTGLGRDRLADLVVTAPLVVTTSLTVMTRDAPDVVIDRDPDGKPKLTILGAGFTLRLKPGRTVRGIVRDRDTHEPIAGMWVGPDAMRMKYGTGDYPTVSDTNGRFTISGIDPEGPRPGFFAVSRPGLLYYMTAKTVVNGPPLIDCTRGIPFRLKLVDEAGLPVEAEVEYQAVNPNPHLAFLPYGNLSVENAFNRAATIASGIYQGYVLPGPGAVCVKTPGRDYQPAHVNPKAFFAPGRSTWTGQELITSFGTEDEVSIPGTNLDQLDYAAIVLVNPPVGSKPLELEATVTRDRPRTINLIDPEGKPIRGVRPRGLTSYAYDREPLIRSSTFQLTRINPERARRIRFFGEDRKLVGFLLARGDDATPCTVRLQPWGAFTGRILDENGKPVSASLWCGPTPSALVEGTRMQYGTHDNPSLDEFWTVDSDREGRYRIERLVPGQRYSAEVYRGRGMYAGMAFENLVLQPGEVRNLGDIHTQTPVSVIGK